MQYQVIKGAYIGIFGDKVSEQLALGWECLGAVVIHIETLETPVFYQAMIKK